MLFSRGFSRIQRSSFNGLCRCFLSHRRDPQFVAASAYSLSLSDSTQKIMGCREFFSWGLPPVFHVSKHQIHQQSSSVVEEPLDPFSLVSDELSIIANRLRAMVVAEVPKLASAAEYFFKMGVEGKRFRPTVLLLMSTALNITVPEPPAQLREALSTELRARQQCIAEVTEMIHVASLLHDDVLDDADTRRGVGSLNCVMGNKLAVLAGDFLLSRACVALASLRNTEVVSLLSTVVEHLVTGETMQMTTTSDQRCSMEFYIQKTYFKTASLISNSCKAIAVLAGHTTEVATLAYEYGKNLGLAFQLIDDVLDFTGTSASLGKGSLSDIRHGIVTAPILFAMEEFPQLRTVVEQGLDNNPANIELALDYLGRSRGIHRTRELATKHANLAAAAIESLPESEDENVRKSRRALLDLTHIVITRTK
ncbi:solanesyl diphosphate synthase 3 [Pyrus ussuriensis x Pyrus communis]|uniref:Solanesyl diphosphate synthase 3 n=1 Tax=Pyrus ussuriensis x Pyrus communis TaxID=2448454 RepID=A0A5N5FJT2_9ROSA|nr:solanesyl diphosphate synthase 3, chloroplastic/mitochondrial [Pyrus x bretschneideri]KAB2601490.1 solanesyl diphosphate synthase 3 [Pyrus ussuriensis x Pyrus communis]